MDPITSLQTVTDDKLPCDSPDCTVEHLAGRKKAHSMTLSIDSPSSSEGKTPLFIADETPTPTRFIRNCEEVGLFQDLQHVNPFDEQFRRAAEAVSQASPALSVTSDRQTDDVLHTPHVFPPAVEADPVLPPPKTSTVRRNYLIPSFSTSECLHLPSPLPTPTPTTVVTSSSLNSSATQPATESCCTDATPNPPPKKRGRKPNVKNENPPKVSAGTVSIKPRQLDATTLDAKNSSLQLLLRLSDGRVVQIPAVQVASESSSSTNATNITVTSTPSQPQVVNSTAVIASVVESAPINVTPTLSEAKIKLKEALSKGSSSKIGKNSPFSTRIVHNSGSSDNGTDNDVSTLSTGDPNEMDFSAIDESRESRKSISDNEPEADKRQKYLERNRAAAFRSRQKRKRWINSLEQRNNDLNRSNRSLQTEVTLLRSEVAKLKAMLLAHKECPVTLAMNKTNGTDEITNPAIMVSDVIPPSTQITPILATSSTNRNNNNNINNNLPGTRQIILVNTAAAPLLALPVVTKALNS